MTLAGKSGDGRRFFHGRIYGLYVTERCSQVYAVDVGHGQLAWKLRNDERVVCMEKTNIRYVTPEDVADKINFSSIDVSFISLTKVLGPVKELLADDGSDCMPD